MRYDLGIFIKDEMKECANVVWNYLKYVCDEHFQLLIPDTIPPCMPRICKGSRECHSRCRVSKDRDGQESDIVHAVSR